LIHYHQKVFRVVENCHNGETSPLTIFHYLQTDNIVSANYAGGGILAGHLLGLVDAKGNIDMHYHQVNNKGEIMTGICKSIPEILPNGKIRLHEKWQWTSGDCSSGESIIEEI
jgi:hypothetical protein